ncbi:hypothetical protein [Flaviflagellibacter deserti]|uniref:Uncharacterized protein n=1 Tax=Flaviflagellibacter deserti TaxID=2267266 RepID=A0ABV9Z4E3_9HYPH
MMKLQQKIISPYSIADTPRFVHSPFLRALCDGAGALFRGTAIGLAMVLQISFVVAAGWVVLRLA